jgi:glycosyl transferase family 87
VIVASAVGLWLLVRIAQLWLLGWGTGHDIALYRVYAAQWSAGVVPYLGFHPEYPPGALVLFWLPWFIGGARSYATAFALEMAGFDLAACVLVVQITRQGSIRWPVPILASTLYTLVTAALFPVLYARFDIAPAALLAGALYALHRERWAASAALLGVAGAVKLWPLALLPLWLAWTQRRRGTTVSFATVALTVAGTLLVSLPALVHGGPHVASFLVYHASRGIQIESTWATVGLLLDSAGLVTARREFQFGAFQLVWPSAPRFAALAMPAGIVLALAPQVAAIVRGWRTELPERQVAALDHAALGGVLGLMIGSKVLSPQYVLWIAPLMALIAGGPPRWGFALALPVLTTVLYPYLHDALAPGAPGHEWALLTLVARNALLVGWYGAALVGARGADASPIIKKG